MKMVVIGEEETTTEEAGEATEEVVTEAATEVAVTEAVTEVASTRRTKEKVVSRDNELTRTPASPQRTATASASNLLNLSQLAVQTQKMPRFRL